MLITFLTNEDDKKYVKTINGTTPDENGNVEIEVSGDSGQNVDLTGYAKEAWVQEGFQPKGDYLTEIPEGYAKTGDIPTKPEDIGAQPAGSYLTKAPVDSVNGKTGAVVLNAADMGALPDTYTPPIQTAAQVGADPKGTAASAVSAHNTSGDAHSDIRSLIEGLTTRLNALANSTDTDLDQMAELVAYIKSNKSLIDAITTSKVSVADIINNLTTNVANKPLSAAQGVTIKTLIDQVSASLANYQPKGNYALASDVPTKVSQLANDKGYLIEHQDISGKLDTDKLPQAVADALAQAKASGEFDGAPGYTPKRKIDYWTDEDQETIVQQVIAALGTPVFGRIEDGNKIITTGNLAAGTYEYWYEDKSGKQVLIGTLDHDGKDEPTYTNVLPTAINSDGTQYVGKNGEDGYKSGYRLGSGGAESKEDGRFVTGFIKVTPGDTIYLKNIGWYQDSSATGKCYVHAYNTAFTMATTFFLRDNTTTISDMVSKGSVVFDTNNHLTTVKIDSNVFGPDYGEIAYIRLSAHYIGADSIITINEPIE